MLLALLLLATDPRAVFYGAWEGESKCTNVRPACHDEHAVYHIAPSAKPGFVSLDANKVVDGKEETMGTTEFRVDGNTLSSEFANSTWTLVRDGSRLTGTAKQTSDGKVFRNIRLEKR